MAIAVAVIAVLATAAAPLVLGQGHRAQDTRAKTSLNRLVTEVESCRLTASSYSECDEPSELERNSESWGRGAGQAGVLTARSQRQAFTAYAVSGSGRRVYVVIHDEARVSKRVCRHGSVPRLERDGCDEPGW